MPAQIRKLVVQVDEIHREMDRPVNPPTRRALAMAVIANQYAGRYVDTLDELIAIGIDDEEVAVANAMSGASADAWNAVRHGAPCTTCPFCIQPVPTGPAMHRSTRTGKPFCPHCAADPTRTVDMKRIEALIIKC